MRYKRGSSGGAMVAEQTNYHRRAKFGALLSSTDDNTATFQPAQQDDKSPDQNNSLAPRDSSFTSSSPRYSYYYPAPSSSGDASPSNNTNYLLSPYSNSSPYTKSPWIIPSPFPNHKPSNSNTGLIGSIVREEGHVYSLAASGCFLYSGSDSRNIRVWKNLKDFSGFKAGSGLVKAIVPCNDKIFTGHQDGKIRVWKAVSSFKNPNDIVSYKRTGSLPTFKDTIKSSVNPKNYVEVRRNKNVLRIKHYDAVSCLSLNEDQGLLYSGSWDKTVKVWRVKDYKCLESITAHDDAVNSVAAGFDSLVFTGSADGTVKVWRRELHGKGTRHFWIQTLLKQDHAVTSIAVNKESAVVYCGTSDGLVNFWERDKHLSHGGGLRGHKMAVLCLASAGSLVFSGSADRTVSVWRREKDGAHTWLSVLTGHGGPIKCLAVEEDNYGSSDDDDDEGEGRRWIVYSGSLDKSVRVWRVCENAPEVSSGEYQSPHRKSCYSPSSCSYSSSPTENGTYIRGKEGTETEECDASGV